MYLLQAPVPDLSWLVGIGEATLTIILLYAIVRDFVRDGWPKLLEHRIKNAEINANANKGVLFGEISDKLEKIENKMDEDARNRETRQAEIDHRLDAIESNVLELSSIISDNEELIGKVSQGTLENMLANEGIDIFKRLKAFRRLLAMKKNGAIKEKGMELILENKKIWRYVLDTELGIEIMDQKYYDDVLAEIERRIFD